jgi:Glutaminyl-tRNA synthetase, non-specific RNA binding region part 1
VCVFSLQRGCYHIDLCSQVTAEDVSSAVREAVQKNEASLRKDRYRFPSGRLVGVVSKQLKWATGDAVRAEVIAQIEALLGPKTAEDQVGRLVEVWLWWRNERFVVGAGGSENGA